MTGITYEFSKLIHSMSYEQLPREVIERTKLVLADYYASGFAGYALNRQFNNANLRYIKTLAGCEEASIMFDAQKVPAQNAAYMNSIYVHGADLDDGNRLSAGHIGTSVISALFAVIENKRISWRDIILAINAGYETFNRIAGDLQPGMYNKGFHSTGIAGGIAAGVGCAKVFGFSAEDIYRVISLTAIQSSGILLIDESGQDCKPINPANAAQRAVASVRLVQNGVSGPINPLESKKGWANVFSTGLHGKSILQDWGKRFSITDSYIKLYPSCRHTHCVIDAMIEIHKELYSISKSVDAVEKIYIYIYSSAIISAGTIRWPRTVNEAKFSITYAASVSLCEGHFSLDDLINGSKNVTARSLSNIITIIEDNSLEKREEGIRGTRVEIVLDDGRNIEKQIDLPKGEGLGSLSWDDLKTKTDECVKMLPINEFFPERAVSFLEKLDVNAAFSSINDLLL